MRESRSIFIGARISPPVQGRSEPWPKGHGSQPLGHCGDARAIGRVRVSVGPHRGWARCLGGNSLEGEFLPRDYAG